MRVPLSRHSIANGRAQPTRTIDPYSLARVNRLRRRAGALLDTFSAMPRGVLLAIALVAVSLVSVVDYITGPLLSLAILYLIPIVFSAWFLGRGPGNVVAVFATVASAVADQLGPAAPQRSVISYWNDASVLAVSLGVVYLVTVLRTTWTYDNSLVATAQASLLPAEISQVEGCQIAGEWRPAGVVGGDYYDVLPITDGSVALCVADVSGKGMPAALLMSNVQAGLRALIGEGLGLSGLVTRLNALIARNVGERRFITLFLGVLDPLGRRLAFCNAGHNPPILMRPDGSWERLSTGGPVLGVLPRAIYRDEQVTAGPGDRLILYTDGLTERSVGNGEEFGETRLMEVVRANRAKDAIGLRDAIVDSVETFGTGSFEDDLTILVVAVT